MISLLDKYIAKRVISASLLILFLLIMLRAMFALLEESNAIGKGNYQIADALLYVSLMLPQKVLELFPMGVLIGSLFGLGVLAANNELTIMRAAGMTTWRIAGSTLKGSLVLMIIVLFLSEVVAPIASKTAQQLKTTSLSDGKISRSASGLWAKQNVSENNLLDSQIIHIESIHKGGQMKNVSLYQLSKNYRLAKLIEAKTAAIADEKWYLFDVKITEFIEESDVSIASINIEQVAKILWENPLEQDNIDTLTLQHETLNIQGLIKYQEYLVSNALDASEVELSIWQKLLMPISVAIMMLLAASFVFGPMRDVSMGARVLTGVLLGFGFHLAKQSFGPISLIYGVSPFLGAVIPLVGFAGLAYWLMRKSG